MAIVGILMHILFGTLLEEARRYSAGYSPVASLSLLVVYLVRYSAIASPPTMFHIQLHFNVPCLTAIYLLCSSTIVTAASS